MWSVDGGCLAFSNIGFQTVCLVLEMPGPIQNPTCPSNCDYLIMFPMGERILLMSRQRIYANLHPKSSLEDPQACTFIRADAVDSFRAPGWVTQVFLVLGDSPTWRRNSTGQRDPSDPRSALEAVSLWPGSCWHHDRWQDQNPGHPLRVLGRMAPWLRGMLPHLRGRHINAILRSAMYIVILNPIAAKHGRLLLRSKEHVCSK